MFFRVVHFIRWKSRKKTKGVHKNIVLLFHHVQASPSYGTIDRGSLIIFNLKTQALMR
jgi:hypothetical protein